MLQNISQCIFCGKQFKKNTKAFTLGVLMKDLKIEVLKKLKVLVCQVLLGKAFNNAHKKKTRLLKLQLRLI